MWLNAKSNHKSQHFNPPPNLHRFTLHLTTYRAHFFFRCWNYILVLDVNGGVQNHPIWMQFPGNWTAFCILVFLHMLWGYEIIQPHKMWNYIQWAVISLFVFGIWVYLKGDGEAQVYYALYHYHLVLLAIMTCTTETEPFLAWLSKCLALQGCCGFNNICYPKSGEVSWRWRWLSLMCLTSF